jgi:hypothetical protein
LSRSAVGIPFGMSRSSVPSSGAVVALLLLGLGCTRTDDAKSSPVRASPVSRAPSNRAPPAVAGGREQLLARIRQADPDQKLIVRALLNDQNELGLIMSRQADLAEIPRLMKVLLGEMANTFPGRDQTAIAYTPTNPPRRIGIAHFDARTRDVTYTSEDPR